MVTEGDHASVQVSPSTLDVHALTATFDDNPEFQDRLTRASVLIVPTDLRPDYDGPVFPIGTPEVFRFLTENLGDQVTVDAAILDKDYIEYEYRSEVLILPVIFVASTVLLPLVVNLLGSFIYDRLNNRRVDKSGATVKSQIHYEGVNGGKFFLEYEGPADTYERVVLQKIDDLESSSNEGGSSPRNERSDSSPRN